jgi:hypothetical protein
VNEELEKVNVQIENLVERQEKLLRKKKTIEQSIKAESENTSTDKWERNGEFPFFSYK